MDLWEGLRQRVVTVIDEVRRDPRFERTVQDAERAWRELEHEVSMIRRQLRENQQPIVDDTQHLKQKLDAYRKKK